MVPKVTVPMNFGRHLIGSPTHSNLKLNASEGGEVRASSVILSFNSPVIDHMTTTLHMTSVDMLEFSEAAVQLFVDAAYSGTVEGITRESFREINKMSHVFEVTWLSKKCEQYFTSFAGSIKTPSYRDLLYLFQEAGFVLEKLKTRNYFNMAIKKIELLKYKQQFIDKYLENAERLSTPQLDMVIQLAGSEVNCVVKTLTNQLSQRLKSQGSIGLPVAFEYLLDNSNLQLCRQLDECLFDQLFDYLRELRDINMHWLFDIHRSSIRNSSPPSHSRAISEVVESSTSAVSVRCDSIPNLYHDFDKNMTFDELLDWLSVSVQVTSLLKAIEAVWTWNTYRRYVFYERYQEENNTVNMSVLSTRLTDMVEKRGWSILPPQLRECEVYFQDDRKDLQIFKLKQFCSSQETYPYYYFGRSSIKKETCSYVLIECVNTCLAPLTVMSEEAKLPFRFKHPSVTSCNLPGECGFILKTVPSEAALWTLRLCTAEEDYLNESVHFHDEIRAESMHVCYMNNRSLFPISWLGWLQDNTPNAVNLRNTLEKKEFPSFTFMITYTQKSRFRVLYKFDT